jgi:DNA invertase Pin-like site-specific DNA recombinase
MIYLLNEFLEEYRLDLQFFSKRLIRTAAYVRVSHEEQKKHGFSVEAQIEGLQKYANENGYIIVEWYIDEAKSARKKSKTRKELTRLVNDAREKKFEMIIFKCIDRWFRNIGEYYRIQEILEDNNINWECSEEDIDTTTREGRLKLNLYLMLAQDEADKGSDRIKYVFKGKVTNGEAIFGYASLPFGFKIETIEGKKRVVIDEEKEYIVNEIFDLYEAYKSKWKVQTLINKKYDLEISYKSISTMLKNTLYCGKYQKNDNYVYGKHYLTNDRWDRIQEILRSNNKSTSTKRDYLFSCLIRCDRCNKTLAGQTSFTRKKKPKVYYRCNNRFMFKRCDVPKSIPEEKLETMLLKHIKPYIQNYIAEYEIGQIKKPKPKIDIKKLRAEQERINKMYRKGRMEEEEYDREFEEIENKIKEADIDESKPKDLTYLKDIFESDIETIYSKLTRAEKSIFWRSFIKEMTIDNETLEILDLKVL